MEDLAKLSRRQLDTLLAVSRVATKERGASLTSVSRALDVSPPSALDHLTTLEDLRLVTRYRGKTRLSGRGEECLAEYRRHHRVAESLFRRSGLTLDETHAAALEVDLALSHRMVDRLCAAEGHPKACPHGEPIGSCDEPRKGTR